MYFKKLSLKIWGLCFFHKISLQIPIKNVPIPCEFKHNHICEFDVLMNSLQKCANSL